MVRAVAIGWKAMEALRQSGGAAEVMAPLTASSYLMAAGEIVWLGGPAGTLHPRAVLTESRLPAMVTETVRVDASHLVPWRPRPISVDAETASAARARGRILVARLAELGEPLGFGPLLLGRDPRFPLEGAAGAVIALARACLDARPAAAVAAAEPLLGLGPGLTPSGDDVVGAALFARAALAEPRAAREWETAARAIVERARTRTHPISVALLGDLALGHGWAPMHELATALASAAGNGDQALGAAHRLVGIGHSSGWDLLAGFLLSLGSVPVDRAR